MRINSIKMLMLFLISITVYSCKTKTSSLAKNINKDVAAAFHVNGKSLFSKLTWQEISQSEWMKQLKSDTSLSQLSKAVLDNPEVTGIDMNNDFVFFFQKVLSDANYAGVTGVIKDAGKFKENAIKITGGAVSESNGIFTIAGSDKLISWKGNDFVMLANVNTPTSNYLPGEDNKPGQQADLKAAANAIFTMKAETSLSSDARFAETMAKNSDMHLWVNLDAIMKNTASLGMVSSLNLSKVYENSAYGMAANFENGKIAMDMKSFMNETVLKIFRDNKNGNANLALAEKIPSNDVSSIASFNINPEGMYQLIKLMGVDGFINMGIAKSGVTAEQLFKAFDGNFFMSTYGMGDTTYSKKPNLIGSIGVKDKAIFEKLINYVTQSDQSMSKNFVLSENTFTLGSSPEALNAFNTATAKNNLPFLKDLGGKSFAYYLNLRKMSDYGYQATDSLSVEMNNATKNTWDYMVMKGGDFDKTGATQTGEVFLLDKNTNSLKVLNNYLSKMVVLENKRREKQLTAYSEDDTLRAPSVVYPQLVDPPVPTTSQP